MACIFLTDEDKRHIMAEIEKVSKNGGKDGKDGAIAVADFYDPEKTYKVGEFCAYGGLLYECVIRITEPEEFNRDKWKQTKLFEFSLWRYIVDNHRYIEIDGVPTYQANTAYHAKCAAVPCRKGDVFYYTGRAHHSGSSIVKNWWILDKEGNVLSSQNFNFVQHTRHEVVITEDKAAKILFNFCLSPTGGEDVYPYELRTPGMPLGDDSVDVSGLANDIQALQEDNNLLWGAIGNANADSGLLFESMAWVSDAVLKSVRSPETAKVGQIIAVKEVDPNGKPIAWEAVDHLMSGGGGQNAPDIDFSVINEEIARKITSPTTAEIGQTIVVKTVDENGKPVEWEAVDLPAGGGSGEWKLFQTVITEEPVRSISIEGFEANEVYVRLLVAIDESFNNTTLLNMGAGGITLDGALGRLSVPSVSTHSGPPATQNWTTCFYSNGAFASASSQKGVNYGGSAYFVAPKNSNLLNKVTDFWVETGMAAGRLAVGSKVEVYVR